LDAFNFSTPQDESEINRKKRSSGRFKCVIASPIFPFLYNRIVPLPLHIFLGLGNQLVTLVEQELSEDDDQADFAIFIGNCKATPTGIGGSQKRSTSMSLNGGELKKIIHSSEFYRLIDCLVDESQKILFHIYLQSVRELMPFLLSPDPLNLQQLREFKELVNLIGDAWHRNKDVVKPKVHMLFHCVAFAEQLGYLGAYSESSIESAHHDVHLTFENHGSSGKNLVYKQRRMHSDILQKRISRIECGYITSPPTPRLCHMCGRPSAKYLNNDQPHQCIAVIQ
jgi:hypothetical protein